MLAVNANQLTFNIVNKNLFYYIILSVKFNYHKKLKRKLKFICLHTKILSLW